MSDAASRRRVRLRNFYRILALKMEIGKCQKCGWAKEPNILQWHHKEKKIFNVASETGRAWKSIERELKKCDLLCPNCHRIIHFKIAIPYNLAKELILMIKYGDSE